MHISLVLKELKLAAVHKTHNNKKKEKIGRYPAILTLNSSITLTECGWEWANYYKPAKIHGIA